MVAPICCTMTGASPSVGSSSSSRRAPVLRMRPIASISSWLRNWMDPRRLVTMPMIDLSVVVLPAPLRPSSVTTSPSRTSNATPCRMWDSSYHACSSRTASSEATAAGLPRATAPAAASRMAGAHVGLHDIGVTGHRGVVALCQHLAAGQHGDHLGEVLDDAQVVLDHQHGAVGG